MFDDYDQPLLVLSELNAFKRLFVLEFVQNPNGRSAKRLVGEQT